MSKVSSLILLLLLGVNHAIHIGDIVVIYTIDNALNYRQTGKLFFYTLTTHTINLFLIYLLVTLFLSVSPKQFENSITQITGGIVALLGVYFIFKRYQEHTIDCTHHAREQSVQSRSLLGIGFLGGFIPCGEVIGIGVISTSFQIFTINILGFLIGLISTLALLMALGASMGHVLHSFRHKFWIRLAGPVLLVIFGLYKIFFS